MPKCNYRLVMRGPTWSWCSVGDESLELSLHQLSFLVSMLTELHTQEQVPFSNVIGRNKNKHEITTLTNYQVSQFLNQTLKEIHFYYNEIIIQKVIHYLLLEPSITIVQIPPSIGHLGLLQESKNLLHTKMRKTRRSQASNSEREKLLK